MKWTLRMGLIMLSIYSAVLIMIEVWISQDFARNFFTDITGPVRFYAINTTISVFLLWSTALIFAIIVCLEDSKQKRDDRNFYLSQILIFAFLGFDDRFLVHEWLGVVLGFNDALILLSVGIMEVVLLLTLGNLRQQRKRTRYYIYLAAFFFILMIVIDGLLPREIVPRLSIEDLAKTWAAAFLFLFSWGICYEKINALKARDETSPI